MDLVKLLRDIAGRLGVIRVVAVEATPPDSPRKVATRSVRIQDLAAEIRYEGPDGLAAAIEDLAVPFDRIFDAAGIRAAPRGWTIERLASMLDADPYKDMTGDALRQAVLARLAEDGVAAEELVKDAVARDRALDACERALRAWLERKAAYERRLVRTVGVLVDHPILAEGEGR
ncbi:MAG: hypothetical protein JXP34_23320 [Planctomycetes bacterium]|nr:hypothetical protein [Planctomycetota bacterium]